MEPDDRRATADASWRERLVARLFAPTDVASLALFRVMFGLILVWEVWRFFDYGWIRTYYIVREVTFKYYGFGWVEPWPGDWMYVHFAVVGVLALFVAVGFLYRLSASLLFLGFTYWFLLDQARYLNHLYLVALLLFLMIFLPAHRACSVDARLWPRRRSETAPAWPLWLLRAQLGLVYFYAGVAKLNGDWLRGAPIGDWLEARSGMPLIGPLLGAPQAVWAFAYGGLLLDLFVAPLLLWRPTRAVAFAAAMLFHLLNKWLFDIGIFPGMMVAATLLFLPPAWPRRACLLFPPLGDRPLDGAAPAPSTRRRRWILGLCGAWLAVQVLVPLRHFLYPGSVHWNEEGHRFAWHMKLRDKESRGVRFKLRDTDTGREWEVNPREWLSTRQTTKVAQWPDMAQQFAHFLAERAREEGHRNVEVRVEALVSLNGRRPQLLIDPDVDLAKEPRTLRHVDWILPLRMELPGPDDRTR